jgi:predicted CopG family antitoxin
MAPPVAISSRPSSIPTTPSKQAGNSSNSNTATINASLAIAAHFEELKRELASFTGVYQEWLESRRRPLIEDKETFLRTLAEEQEITAALRKQFEHLQELKKKIKAGTGCQI